MAAPDPHRAGCKIKTVYRIVRSSVAQCKSAIEDTAELFANYGHADYAGTIYEAAVKSWKPYPQYMLEALGDIAKDQGNAREAGA